MENTSIHPKVKIRDKERTKAKILETVGEIIREENVGKVTPRNVAQKAGVNAVLIYRYFYNQENLIKQYYLAEELRANTGNNATRHTSVRLDKRTESELSRLAIGFLREMRARKVTVAMLKSELIARQTILSADYANRLGEQFKKKTEVSRHPDTSALAAFISAALYFFILAESHPDDLLGIDLRDSATWTRLEAVIKAVTKAGGGN